jgi:hypothetical protein
VIAQVVFVDVVNCHAAHDQVEGRIGQRHGGMSPVFSHGRRHARIAHFVAGVSHTRVFGPRHGVRFGSLHAVA